MPQLAAAFAIWIGSAFGITTTAGAIATAVAYYAALGGIYYGLSVASQKLAAKDLKDQRDFALSINVRSAAQPQIVIYGEAVVGSLLVYCNTKRVSGTSDNFELHFIDVLASHPCEDVVAVYFDNEYISASDINWTYTGSPPFNVGIVTGGIYATGGQYAVAFQKRLGVSNHYPQMALVFPDITTDFKGEGLTWVNTRLWTNNGTSKMWGERGAPSVRRFQVKGKNDIYDPRLEFAAVGTYGLDVTNAVYAGWTNNPILCIADFMRTYCGVSNDRINWSGAAYMANICDAAVPIPPAASPTNYEKRYTLNGGLSLGESCWDTLQAMLTSCLGHIDNSGGVYSIYAGSYNAPSVTLTEADIIGPMTEETHATANDRYNAVRGVYINKLDGWQEMPFYAVESSAYATDDGRTIWRDISLPFTTGEYEAQRIAFKHVIQSRADYTLTVPLRWTGLQIHPGATVDVQFNGLDKAMRCVSWKMGGDNPFSVVLKQDSSGLWADPTVGQYSVRGANGLITQPTEAINSRDSFLPNLLPIGYADFEHVAPMNIRSIETGGGFGNVVTSTAQQWLGLQSLQITPPTGLDKWVDIFFSNATGYYNIPILPTRRYLVIVSIFPTNTDSQITTLQFSLQGPGDGDSGYIDMTTLPLNEWSRRATEINMSNTEKVANLSMYWENSATTTTPPIFYIDGLVVLDVTDRPDLTAINFPATFIPATGSGAGVIGMDGGSTIFSGEGSPESAVPAKIGSLYLRTDGSTSTTLYIKTSGTGNTGWTAK